MSARILVKGLLPLLLLVLDIYRAAATLRTRRRVPSAVATCSLLAAGRKCALSMDLPCWCHLVCIQSCLTHMTSRVHVT